MSGELAAAMWRRALVFLDVARLLLERGEYDVSLVAAEQAAQLALKAVYALLLGYAPRGHSLRRLAGYLAGVLEEAGRREEAEELRRLIAEHRDDLILLEDAYTQGRYALPGYTEAEARRGLRAAEALVEHLGRLVGWTRSDPGR